MLEAVLENKAIVDVKSWIDKLVTKKHPALGNFPPCPYARQALLDNKVLWKVAKDKTQVEQLLQDCCAPVKNNLYDVAITVCTTPEEWSIEDLNTFVSSWRTQHLSQDLYLLRDHPNDIEVINGVPMNQGTYLLFFIQRHSLLTAARNELKALGYFSHWRSEDIDMVTGKNFHGG